MSNLALVLQYQGKREAAVEMTQRALESDQEVLGAEYPRTLTSVNNLAKVLQYRGNHDVAEEIYLGKDHPKSVKCHVQYLEVLKSKLNLYYS
jgi:tetratricopeptide (TPR) repeat protein